MVTTALDYWESDYAVGRRHVDFTGRNSTPDVGAMNDRDAQLYWRVIRGGFIIHREHKILDFQWLGLDADQVKAMAVDRAGNKGSWETYTYSVTANEDADWVRYVDTGGNDTTGDGSEENPWATGAKAVTEAQAALTSGQVGVIFFADDQTHSFSATAYTGSDSTSCLVRFVRQGNGTNRPDLSFATNIVGFRIGRKGVYHIDGCDVTGAHTDETYIAFDLRRTGIAADRDPFNVMVVDCDVTDFGRGVESDNTLTAADRTSGCFDFAAFQNVVFEGTRSYHVYGLHHSQRTLFRSVQFLAPGVSYLNPFRVHSVGRMYCEDVTFDTGEAGNMRLSVTSPATEDNAMRECTFVRVLFYGTNHFLCAISIQSAAAGSGVGLARDLRFVDCRTFNANYRFQYDNGGSNALNIERVDFLECSYAEALSGWELMASASETHTYNGVRWRNCIGGRIGTAEGQLIWLRGDVTKYVAGSLEMHGCAVLFGPGMWGWMKLVNAEGISTADLASLFAASDYNHLGKTTASPTIYWARTSPSTNVSLADWRTASSMDANSSHTYSTTFNATNNGGTVPADADWHMTADSGPLAGTGYPLPLGVSIDADGYLRSPTAPDAGPYEYGASTLPDDPELPAPSNASRMRRHGLVLGLRLRP